MQRSLVEEATRPLVLIAISAILSIIGYFYYRFVYSPYQAFVRTGVKGPTPRILLGNSLEYFKMGEMRAYHKFYQTYGAMFGFYMGSRPVVVIADPSLVDTVLNADQHTFATTKHTYPFLTSTLWTHGLPTGLSPDRIPAASSPPQTSRRSLRLILLLPRLLKMMVPVVLYHCDNTLIDTLKKSLSSTTVDIWSIYEPYCQQVMLGIVGLSSSKNHEKLSSALTNYFIAVNKTGALEFVLRALFGSAPCLEEIMRATSRSSKGEREFNVLLKEVTTAVREAKKHHKLTGIKRNYLQVLLDQSLTEEQVVSQSLLILLLGYHTVLTTLSAASFHLASDPTNQQKLYTEVSMSVERETLLYETVDSLEFLDAVVQETLRLTCFTPKISRLCMKETTLKGATITKGTTVEIPLYLIHHLHPHWGNPYSFHPDRFISTQTNKKSTKTSKGSNRCPVTGSSTAATDSFLPFGRGAHSCLGMKLVVNCVKLTLCEVLKGFRFTRPLNNKVTMEPQLLCASPFRRPPGGLQIRVATRLKLKRFMSFATVVKTAIDKHSSDSDGDVS